MKRYIYIAAMAAAAMFLTGCEKSDPGKDGPPEPVQGADIPEGYFEVVFTQPMPKAPVTGTDARVSDLKYILFKSTGEFVKERRILAQADPAPSWPLNAIRDTLPKGSYRAVFIGNGEKTLFPYKTQSNPVNYDNVLSGYTSGYSSARIILPNADFTDTTEYYMANVQFSNTAPNPTITLQRIIGMLKVHRNFVDAQTALNKLTNNIATNIGARNLIRNQVNNLLPGLLHDKLDLGLGNTAYVLVGGLNGLVNILTTNLVDPVTDALYNELLKQLANELGMVLTGNTNQTGLLAFLGVLLNPWADDQAAEAIVTINNFPKSVDFNLNPKDFFNGDHKFRYKFTGATVYAEKDIRIRNFEGHFNIRNINVIKTGLISGLLVDGIIDNNLLISGTFIDIKDQLMLTNQTNRRYKSDYSFVDLGLTSYNANAVGSKSLTLEVTLGNIANLDNTISNIGALAPILNVLTSLVINPVKTIKISTPLNIPALGIEKLTLSGSWSTPAEY